MSTEAIIALFLLAVSVAVGTITVRSLSKDRTVSRWEKVAAFFAAFVGWPFAAAVILGVALVCWDLLLMDDIDAIDEKIPPRDT